MGFIGRPICKVAVVVGRGIAPRDGRWFLGFYNLSVNAVGTAVNATIYVNPIDGALTPARQSTRLERGL